MTEQEQIEQLKTWIKEYGMTVLAGIILSVIIVSGWHMWDRHQTRILTQASVMYDEMLMNRAQNDKDSLSKATDQAEKIVAQYPKTPYAQMASLMLARDAVLNKKYDDAIKDLDWVISHSQNKPLKQIAMIRLARIYIAQDKPDVAIQTLQKLDDKIFQGLGNEIIGDAYVQMKKIDDAKKSYQLALQQLPQEDTSQRPILEMKLDNLNSKTTA